MTFDEVLEHILTLLKRQGRVSYSALRRRFDLDDAYLNDLKEELLFAHPVVDEEGRGLVWTGETASGQEVTSHRAQPTPQPATQEQQSPQVTPRATASPPPDAERRQLTVMFCDLVDSTKLSSQLDPEDWRDVVRAYQRVCTDVIQRYDGHIAQLLGDGLLVYFGYPQAHEDDAQRAVRTGLGILDAMRDLNQGLQQAKGIQLGVRLGIHTGLVVVGEMGGAGRQVQLALGEVPNLAARLQGLAAPNTVAISEATYRLVEGYFTCASLGAQPLRGVSQPLNVYHVLGESGVHSRLDVAQIRGLTPLVGREQEVGLLLERWEHAKSGQGQVVLLSGDAGIGKSRLVQMLKDHVANEPHTRWECRSSSYFDNTALFSMTDLFQRLLQFETGDTPDEKLGKLEQMLSQYRLPLEESVPLFAPLLALPVPENRNPPLNLSPQRQRQKTLETIIALLLEQAEQHPVLFIVEDLHWTDPTTLDLLNLLIDQTPTASMLVLLTCRPHFQPAWHHRSYLTEMTVNRLSHTQVEQIVTGVTDGKTCPAEVLQQIIEKTDGVPLFVEEITKAILESGQLKAVDGHYELVGSLSTFTIPATLQDSLMARLDRLVTAKAVAQYAAVIGRQFTYALLQAVSQVDEATLQPELGRLVEAELVYQRGLPPQATYTFKHALIQDTASQSLLRSTRQGYHRRIAEVLAERFPETVENQPELLAHHYTEAGLNAQAIGYWQRAGERAVARSANPEAISHLTKGLALLTTLPDTAERTQQELDVLISLGPALIATKGYVSPEVAQVYTRAYALCRQGGQAEQRFSVLIGLRRFYLNRGELGTARKIGEELLTLAQHQHNPTWLLEAYWSLSGVLFSLGEFALVQHHLDQAVALYAAQRERSQPIRHGTLPGIHCLSWSSQTLWMCGYADQALQRSHHALSLARQHPAPFALHFVLMQTAFLHHYRREWSLTQDYVESAKALQSNQRDDNQAGPLELFLYWMVLQCWLLTMQGKAPQGIALMCQWLNTMRGTVLQAHALAVLAEAYGTTHQIEPGLNALAEALTQVEKMGTHFCEAELYRLKGELLIQQALDNSTAAESCFHQAIAVAQNQQAKSWELRAATSLARLWQQQGKRQEASDLLAPVYNWFTEGFDTADLQDAKALLDELA